MLQISGLSKSYGTQTLFEGATFAVGQRERIGLVGRNGHGKSTLFKLILGEEEINSGTISVPRDYRIGHLSQTIEFTEDTILKEGCRGLPKKEDGWEETYRVEAVLHGLGFSDEDFGKDPRLLSGGFQVRLNLAKLLVSESNLLLLDEPTNYLDIVSMRWLARFLRSWPGEMMLITHDRSFMDSVCTHTLGIHREKLRKIKGPTEKLYSQLAEEEEHYEKTRQNTLKKKEQLEVFINRFRYKETKARQVQSKIKAVERMGSLEALDNIDSLTFSFRTADFPAKRMLELQHGSFSYSPDSELLVDDLSFIINKSDKIGIIGKNGKGKTTLLNLLARELKLNKGELYTSEHTRAGYFGQTNVDRLDPKKTVEEEVLSVQPDNNRTAARNICGTMMFEGDLALKKIEVLSGGERSRVLLGKVLVSPSNLLLLDEPTNHLDIYSSEMFRDAVKVFPGAVILVTHDEELLREVATRLIIFDRGKVTYFDGTYDEFLEKVGWEDEDDVAASKESKQTKVKSKKEQRRQRAAELEHRRATLGPLQNRMQELEKQIEDLEQKVAEQNDELIAGTVDGFGDAMVKLSRELSMNKESCEGLYEELEKVMQELEAQELEFS